MWCASFQGTTKTKLVQGDIAVDESEKAILSGLGRSAGENLAVLLWPRKTWRTRVVPYTISGHSRDAIGMLFCYIWSEKLRTFSR